MKMRAETSDDVLLVTVDGDLVGTEIIMLCRRLEALAEEVHKRVVLDLSEVGSIDSYGLGGLAYSDILLRKLGKELAIVVPPQSHVLELIRQCNLDKVLALKDSPRQAGLAQR